MKRRTILIGGGVAGLTAMTVLFAAPNFRKPDQTAMRAHRLSILSDEDLRKLHAKATAEVEAAHADWDRVVREAVASRNVEVAECNSKKDDVAYMTRHYPNGCPPIHLA